MARLKIAYIGGGSTRAAGTIASFVEQGENFNGSEIVLIDLDAERLKTVETIGSKMARNRGIDLTISSTVDRCAGLQDCDAVLTSYRPGGFEARYLDESIPLKHGLIGQETQGAGGFFMALRTIHVMKSIIEDIERVAPQARIFNYTNPINIVSQAITKYSAIPTLSFCEGPIVFPVEIATLAGLDPVKLDTVMIGLNHACWTVRHLYEGQNLIPLLADAYERLSGEDSESPNKMRLLKLAVQMESIPASYFQYYYFKDEITAELKAKPTTRAQDIMARVPDYWHHYQVQAASDDPQLDPEYSRGGLHELELAIDAMDAIYNDRKEILPVNALNGGALTDFPDDMIIEGRGYFDRNGVTLLADGALPQHVTGLVKALGEYQMLTAEAAWHGKRIDGVRALASHPLIMSLEKAEVLYDEMAAALHNYLPERLLF